MESLSLVNLPVQAVFIPFLLVLVLVSLKILQPYVSSGSRFPPGPTPLPIVGNVFQIPKQYQWIKFKQWGEIWGDVVYVTSFRQRIIILNSQQAAIDLLDKRSLIYSSRPAMRMARMCGLSGGPLEPYNERFKHFRRLLNKGLAPTAFRHTYRPMLEDELKQQCLVPLLNDKDFSKHLRNNASAVILKTTYGYEVEGDRDAFVKMAEDGMRHFAQVITPGVWLVDSLSILQYLPLWFPGAGFKRYAMQARRSVHRMAGKPFKWTKRMIAEGKPIPISFTSNILEERDKEDEILEAAGAIFAGGTDATVALTQSFIHRMAVHPDVQARAQAEIDDIVGRARLPGYSDEAALPYVAAVIKEVWRFNASSPLGGPHMVTQDDIYNGYLIPKGTTIIANIWGMCHDERTYKNPFEFNPERFLGPKAEQDPRDFAFGFGRRICPGLTLANDEFYISVTQILAAFTISNATDQYGKAVGQDWKYCSGAVRRPEPFNCQFEPRFPDTLALLTESPVDSAVNNSDSSVKFESK